MGRTRQPGRRCTNLGCHAWAMRGAETCRAHTTQPALAAVEVLTAAEVGASERERAVQEFNRALAGGRFAALLPEALARIIAEAGREGMLLDEIGALRVVLKQLLAVEGANPELLSLSVPRVVGAIVRALRAQRLLTGDAAGDLVEALTRVLTEMGLGE